MTKCTQLTSPQNPHVKAVIGLRKQRDRRARGVFIAEGVREVSRALAAGLTTREIYRCPKLLGDRSREAEMCGRLEPGVNLFEVSPDLFRKMSYRDEPEGLLGVFDQPTWDLDSVAPSTDGDDLWLVAVGLQKPGNLGAIVRSAAAVGCRGVLVADGIVDPFNPNAIRASTGAVFGLPVVDSTSGEILAALTHWGARIYAATSMGGVPYTQVDLRGPVALVVGAEDTGLDERWLAMDGGANGAEARCAGRAQPISIPMHKGGVDSLNASVAAGVLLFEAARQRGEPKRSVEVDLKTSES